MPTKIRTESIEDVKREANPDEEVLDLRGQVAELRRRLDDYKRDTGSLKSFFRSVIEHLDLLPAAKPLYRKPKVKSGQVRINNPIVAVAQFNDWHMGAVQSADEVEGFGEFSPEIAFNRVNCFVDSFSKWVEAHRSVYSLHELNILVLGDLISGDIHDELRVTNAFPVPAQVVEAARLLSGAIHSLSRNYATTHVHFITEDNHARLTKKPQEKEAGLNSLNYLVGYIARERLMKTQNLHFKIWPMFQKTVDVSTRRYLLTHGHKVKGWAGFPYYGIERKAHREAMKRMTMNLGKFDKVIMGHWHSPLCHPYYWIGGSLTGTDAYDHSAGRHAKPSQAAWMVHPKHGEFDRTDFDLGV